MKKAVFVFALLLGALFASAQQKQPVTPPLKDFDFTLHCSKMTSLTALDTAKSDTVTTEGDYTITKVKNTITISLGDGGPGLKYHVIFRGYTQNGIMLYMAGIADVYVYPQIPYLRVISESASKTFQ